MNIDTLTVDVRTIGIPEVTRAIRMARVTRALCVVAVATIAGALAWSPRNAAVAGVAAVLTYVVCLGIQWAFPSAWKLLVEPQARELARSAFNAVSGRGMPMRRDDPDWRPGPIRWRYVPNALFYAFREARYAR